MVGGRGFEPLTSSVSRKRSPPELTARVRPCYSRDPRRGPESNRCARLCRPLPKPLGHPAERKPGHPGERPVYPAPRTCQGRGELVLDSRCGQAGDLSGMRLDRDPRDHTRPRHLRRRHGVGVRRVRLGVRSPDRTAARGSLEELHPPSTHARPRRRGSVGERLTPTWHRGPRSCPYGHGRVGR